MNCKKAVDLMSDYVDECVADRARIEFEAHVTACEHCSVELRAMRSMLSSLGSLRGCKAPVDCWVHVRQRIVESEVTEPPRRVPLLRPALAICTFAVAVLLAAFLIWPSAVDQPPAPAASVSIPEYTRYISAHSRVRQREVFTDPVVTFVAAELETADLPARRERP